MCLSANSIKFVFHKKLARHRPCYVCQIGGGSCQHEFDGMKQTQVDVLQVISPGANGSFTDVAKKHVHLSYHRQRPFESPRNRIFDESFSKPNSQVTSQQLDEVLRLERRSMAQHGC